MSEKEAKYKLWEYFNIQHDLILTDTELNDIVMEVEKYQKERD